MIQKETDMKKAIPISATIFSALLLSACSNPQSTQTNQINNLTQTNTKNKTEVNQINQEKQMDNSKSVPEEKSINLNETNYLEKYNSAAIKTNYGTIKLKLYNSDTPKTVNNFFKLAEEKFYDGVKFHRIIKGFMIQGGDPNSKDDDWSDDGMGGPGYTVPAEIKMKNTKGTIATARLGDQVNPKKESSGSQFFINTADNAFLDGQYTVFGEVIEGMDTVLKIESVKTNENDHPTSDVVIQSIELSKI